MKKRKHTREFKLSILNELNSKQVVEVCREHNLNPSMVTRWKKEFKESPNKAFNGNGNLWKMDAELERYKRLVGELYAEIDFLKKTTQKLQQLRIEEEKMRFTK